MTRDELEAVMAMHDVFDGWLLFHAYRAYGRDYKLIVTVDADPHHTAGVYSYLFRHCVAVETRTLIRPETWRESLDDRLTSFDAYKQGEASGAELAGFIQAQGATLYPGWKLVGPSERAERWTQAVGIDFHELKIESNVFETRIIFSDLIVTQLSDQREDIAERLPVWAERYWIPPAGTS